MTRIISRWIMFGLLIAWALSHASVFGQDGDKKAKGATAAEKLRASLDKTVTFDYTGQSLTDVLNHFRDKTGIAINVDPIAMMQMGVNDGGGIPGGVIPGVPMAQGQQVQLKATNEKAGQVLRRLLNAHQLAYILFEDAVLITTEDAALVRQMRQRVTVDLEDVPFSKAVRNLARTHGINLVIDPKVAKQADAPVSLQLDNTGIETTVRLLAELANLKAVRMGNVLFVTSEEKAKKIREEEPNQLDNLNPNNPLVPPGIRFGFGGMGMGGFGGAGIALPTRVAPAIPLQGIPNNVAPPPPPGVDLPIAPDRPVQSPPAPPKKGETRPAVPPPPPPPPPGVESSPAQPASSPPRVIRN
ncbi:MAG: hypothetical protein HYR84_16770 [Planctomycetes bacterium]|nr:hypothetical protein [Planctomycetota bacterium]